MSDVPENLYYSQTHEWLREEDGIITIGITDHAQSAAGDMVYVELPEVGDVIEAKGECGVLESVKSASDIYSPLAGEIVAINEFLADSPDLVNKDPYGDGWILKIKPKDPEALEDLMDAQDYKEFLQGVE